MDECSCPAVPGARKYFWIVTLLSAIVLFAPIRAGDLAGYDDAFYSMVAKDIVQTGHWMDIRSNGGPTLEHPPLFPWMQAALFSIFGFSDTLAKLPSAFCGFGTILLTGWLARRFARDAWAGVLAMFVMATTIYFLKYSARAMTDVPFTFFFLCSVCAWALSETDPRWYLAAGLFVAIAQMTRAMMGLSLPILFAIDAVARPRRAPLRYVVSAFTLAFLPPMAWYGQWIYHYGPEFFATHANFLHDKVYGPLSPAWRRYTGAVEYLWMISKSYWPWLPAMLAGLIAVIRGKNRRLHLLIFWIAVVFGLCAIARSRVLRYILPAYPAFSILSAIGIFLFVSASHVRTGLRVLLPLLTVFVLAIAIWPPVNWHAADTRPIALAATKATSKGELITFYDAGQPRNDELNELLWYGDRFIVAVWDPGKLDEALQKPRSRIFVVDAGTFRSIIEPRLPSEVVARSGHLVCFRLCVPKAAGCAGA